jgi:hypothetical protein
MLRLDGLDSVCANDPSDPDAWIAAVQRRGYRAACCPLKPDADDATIRACRSLSRGAGASERLAIMVTRGRGQRLADQERISQGIIPPFDHLLLTTNHHHVWIGV